MFQIIRWFRLHGWKPRYWGYTIVTVILFAIAALVKVGWDRFWKSDERREPSTPAGSSPPAIEPARPVAEHPKERLRLSTFETAVDILAAVNSPNYTSDERRKVARSLYVDRWIIHPWNGRVRSLPTKEGNLWTFAVAAESADAHETATTIIESTKDASPLRMGIRIHFTGRIKEVTTSEVVIGNADFQMIE